MHKKQKWDYELLEQVAQKLMAAQRVFIRTSHIQHSNSKKGEKNRVYLGYSNIQYLIHVALTQLHL